MAEAWGRNITTEKSKAAFISWAAENLIAKWAISLGLLNFGPIGWIAGIFVRKGFKILLDEGIIKINELIVRVDIHRDVKKIESAREEIIKSVESKDGGIDLAKLDKDMVDAYKHISRPDRLRL